MTRNDKGNDKGERTSMERRLVKRPLRLRRSAEAAPPGRAEGLGRKAFDRLGLVGAACAIGAWGVLLLTADPARAQEAQPATALVTGSGAAQPVVASGVLPDEATRAAVLQRLREVYGSERVVDQLQVGPVVAPANWSGYVGKLLTPELKQVSKGSLGVRGNEVELRGEVANEAQRQELASKVATSLNPTYTVRNQLQVARAGQGVLDAALADRIVEFQPGSAVLTPSGRVLLDQMAQAVARVGGHKVEVVGHTDASGDRRSNILLSQARAEAVKAYLVDKGIGGERIAALGAGSDRPVADNATPEGRARNRRIEFRLMSAPSR